jgi:RNA polymerase sigma-70 factor (ECF subfamily)
MAHADLTCWTIIQAAAAGSAGDRADFALRYGPVVRDYFTHRWRTSSGQDDIDDEVQEVFVECFKQGGILERAEPGRPGAFGPSCMGSSTTSPCARNLAGRARAHSSPQAA